MMMIMIEFSLLGPQRCNLAIFKVMDQFNVCNLVPRDRPISFQHLASAIEVHEEIVKRMFRLAFGINLFKEEPKGYVAHTSLSSALPKMSGWLKFLYRQDICDAMLSWPDAMSSYDEPKKPGSIPFNLGNGHDKLFFDVMQEEDGMSMFTEAMKSVEAGRDEGHILHGYDWATLGEGPIVDLGGGDGHVSIPIAKEYPELRVIIQDLEANREHAANLIPTELKHRFSFQAQDFFRPQSCTTGAKVFFMRHIMHDWPDEDAVRILQQLVPEVEKGAKIIICDRLPNTSGPRSTSFETLVQWLDILMWTILGAKERSAQQWTELLKKTDRRLRILNLRLPIGSEDAMIEVGF
jgi:hypothetical protein